MWDCFMINALTSGLCLRVTAFNERTQQTDFCLPAFSAECLLAHGDISSDRGGEQRDK